jgi:hypothetical protein
MEDVSSRVFIRMVSMITSDAPETLQFSIPPISMTTGETPLTGKSGRHSPKGDTVPFALLLKSGQPITDIPPTDSGPHAPVEPAGLLGPLCDPFEVFNNDQRTTGRNLFSTFIDPLLQSSDSPSLALGAMLTSADSIDVLFDISSDLFTRRESSEGINSSINANASVFGELLLCDDFETELHVLLSNHIRFQTTSEFIELVELLVTSDRKIETNLFSNTCEDQPTVKLGSLGLFKSCDGRRDTHPSALMGWLDGLLFPFPLGCLDHIDRFSGCDFSQSSRQPRVLRKINDGLQQLGLLGTIRPEMADENVHDSSVLGEDFSESRPFLLGRELQATLGRADELHRPQDLPIRSEVIGRKLRKGNLLPKKTRF